MEMTNYTFSDDDESFQSQTLKDNIQNIISRRLILDSTPSPRRNQTMMVTPLRCHSPTNLILRDEIIRGDTPVLQTPVPHSCNPSLVLVPSPYSPQTPRAVLVNRAFVQTPIISPPSRFRDVSGNNLGIVQEVPFDLTTNRALDLRVCPTLPLMMELEPECEQDQPLALVKPKEESITLFDISTQTDSSHISPKQHKLKTSSTCTSLDDTVFYPRPARPTEFNQTEVDSSHTSPKEHILKTVTPTCTSLDDTIFYPHPNRPAEVEQTEVTCVGTSTDSLFKYPSSGLDTIKQSYSLDDTHEKTSTTVIIDDAFHYLEDIPEEASQDMSDNCPNNPPTNNCRDLNRTFEVVRKPVLAHKPPTGLSHKRNSQYNVIRSIDAAPEANHDEQLKGSSPIEKEHVQSASTEESSCDLSSSESSSFTTVTSLDSEATSQWSVKPSDSKISSGLILTLTKASSSSLFFSSQSTIDFTDSIQKSNDSLSFTPRNRIVIGADNSIEESTIVKEASVTSRSQDQMTFVSYPATPDVSLCQANHSTSHKGCSTESAIQKYLSSTPRKIRHEPVGNDATPQKQKEESLRTKVMKKSTPMKPSTDSESVLNIAFRSDLKKSTPVKRKKKSLFKALKKQLLCNNASNSSQLSQHDQTVTANCLGRVIKPQQRKKQSWSQNLFAKCNNQPNVSSSSVSIVTLNKSTYSASMPSWCKHIFSTTGTASTPKPLSTSANEEPAMPATSANTSTTTTSKSKSVGISTTSLTSATNDDTVYYQQRQNPLFDSVGISWLSQIEPCHTPDRSTTQFTSTTTQEQLQQNNKGSSTSFKQELINQHQQAPNGAPSPSLPSSRHHTSRSNSSRYTSNPNSSQSSSLQFVTLNQTSVDDSSPKSNTTKASGPQEPNLRKSHSSTVRFDVRNCVPLHSESSKTEMIENLSTATAEMLTTFMMDKDMRRFDSRFYLPTERKVLLELCRMCDIKVKVAVNDPYRLLIVKTSTSRAPTDVDVKRIIRGTRR